MSELEQPSSNELLMRETAAALAHRGCCGSEHDPANGKLHGYCVVCGVPWPCDTAKYYLRPSVETTEPMVPEANVLKFIGWLTADFIELKDVEVPQLQESWERFNDVMANRAAVKAREPLPNDAYRWVCPTCRTVNDIADANCEIRTCNTPRPADLMCLHLMDPRECSICSALNGSEQHR